MRRIFRLGLNPRTRVPEASMLTTRPPKPSEGTGNVRPLNLTCVWVRFSNELTVRKRTRTSTWIWAPVSYTTGYTVPLVNQMQLNELLSFSAPWISLLSSGMWRPDAWYRLNNASEKHDNLVRVYEHCRYRTLASQLRQEVLPRHR